MRGDDCSDAATSKPPLRAAQRATSTIPILGFGELLSEGVIGSLARPGGNTTGVSILNTDLDAKRLEVLKQIVPSGQRFEWGKLDKPKP